MPTANLSLKRLSLFYYHLKEEHMVSLIVVLHHFMGRFKFFPKETMISSSDLIIDWPLAYIMFQRSNLIAKLTFWVL